MQRLGWDPGMGEGYEWQNWQNPDEVCHSINSGISVLMSTKVVRGVTGHWVKRTWKFYILSLQPFSKSKIIQKQNSELKVMGQMTRSSA